MKILHSFWTLVASCAIAFQHLLLSYHVIRRKYSLYVIRENESAEKQTVQPATGMRIKSRRRHHNGKLVRSRFESYFREKKPYLDSSCKIADLVEVFDVNRSVISAFINKTYGMNFNCYLNHWRIKELDRLRSLPSNHGKSVGALIERAGFDNYRTYLRAAATGREIAVRKGTDKEKGERP